MDRGKSIFGKVHQHPVFLDLSAPEAVFSKFSGTLDFEHIEEQAEGIFGGRKVYFQCPVLWVVLVGKLLSYSFERLFPSFF